VAAGPVSRIRRAALQTYNLFRISRHELLMMSTLSVMAGFASHRRHNVVPEGCIGLPVIEEQGPQLRTQIWKVTFHRPTCLIRVVPIWITPGSPTILP